MATEDATTNPPEIWKPVVDWEGLYEVSNQGRVRSLTRRVRCRVGMRTSHGKMLSLHPHRKGYKRVILNRPGERKTGWVHLLVLEAFVGPRPHGRHIEGRHLDGNSLNCALENLAWGTAQQNADDRRRHDTVPKGEGHFNARLTASKVAELRRLRRECGLTWAALAGLFEVSQGAVYLAGLGKTWRHVPMDGAA